MQTLEESCLQISKISRGKTFFFLFFPQKAPSWRNASVRWDVCTPHDAERLLRLLGSRKSGEGGGGNAAASTFGSASGGLSVVQFDVCGRTETWALCSSPCTLLPGAQIQKRCWKGGITVWVVIFVFFFWRSCKFALSNIFLAAKLEIVVAHQ